MVAPAYQDPVAGAEVGLLLAVASEGGLQTAAEKGDLDHRVEAHHHGADRKSVRTDWCQRQHIGIRAHNGATSCQGLGRGSRG